MKLLSLLYILLGGSGILYAQQTSPPRPVPPPGPLIQKRAPDFTSWSLTLKLTDDSTSQDTSSGQPKLEDPKNIITKTTVTKTGDIVRVEFIDNQGRDWNTWIKGGEEVVAWPDKKSVGFAAKPQTNRGFNPIYHDFSVTDFPGFEWISLTNFTGIKPVAGINCLVFKDQITISGILVSVSAATDLKTRLPVQLVAPNGVTTYEFQPTPAAMQELPAAVQNLIDTEQRKEQALARRPEPAY